MKKLLAFASIVALTATAMSAQFRNQQAQRPTQMAPEGFVLTDEAQPQMEMTAEEIQAAIAAKKLRADGTTAPTARYHRPSGVYYNPLYTRDSNESSIWGYNAPQLHATSYVPLTFLNSSTDADSYEWSCKHKSGFSTETVTSTEKDFTIDFITTAADSVPNLTAINSNGRDNYYLQGINSENAVVRSAMFTYPDWEYSTSSTQKDRHAWETPNYWALRHPQFDATKSASTYFTMNSAYKKTEKSAAAYSFGCNSAGFDHVATAFEKPAYPYNLKNVGVRYQNLAWDSTGTNQTAVINVMVYKVDALPAYDESTYVTITPGELIAEGNASLSSAFSLKQNMLNIPVYDVNGGKPEITDNILVVVTGYNDPENGLTDFTLTASNDIDDEGYGEMGYQGLTTDNGVIFRGINNLVKAGFKSVPSIFIETERPWLTTNSSTEELTRNYAAEGETYDLELFSFRSRSTWRATTGVPSWAHLDMTEDTGSELGYTVHCNVTVDPLPAGTNYREATIHFSYPGAMLDYTITQGDNTQTVKPGDANGDGEVNVNDVTVVINYILEKNPTPFVFDNADVNGDGAVTVLDVTAIINMILNNN
ncbi:MAG: dockerin type I repeat-containing protein [Muribaculaceae bacterium]|nr:dockerin type I repeat-containing protein [Muribaculaceae bacterium]